WKRLDFWLGVLTTLLVILAWSISIVSQPLATTFGCSVALAGMAVAYVNYVRGRAPVVTPYLEGRMPESLLAVLAAGDQRHDVVRTAEHAEHFDEINPDRIRYELTPRWKIAHLLKRW